MSEHRGLLPRHRAIVLGCVAAFLASVVSCLVVGLLATGPAFRAAVPAAPTDDPTKPDITMLMREEFMNKALLAALPASVPVEGVLDVQPGNRLVFDGQFSMLFAKVPVVMTLGITHDGERIRISLDSLEAAGYEILELTGLDARGLTDTIGEQMEQQILAGLGPGAEIMSIATDDEHLIIATRFAQ